MASPAAIDSPAQAWGLTLPGHPQAWVIDGNNPNLIDVGLLGTGGLTNPCATMRRPVLS